MYIEIIDIVDDANMYPSLLGIDWDIKNKTVIKLKKRISSFEVSEMWVVAPIDTLEGQRYFEPVKRRLRKIPG